MEPVIISSLEQVPNGITLLFERISHLENLLQSRLQPLPIPKEEEYLTRTQVCELLGVSYPTLKLWTLEGKVKGYRLGNRVRYKKSEIDQAFQAIKPTTP